MAHHEARALELTSTGHVGRCNCRLRARRPDCQFASEGGQLSLHRHGHGHNGTGPGPPIQVPGKDSRETRASPRPRGPARGPLGTGRIHGRHPLWHCNPRNPRRTAHPPPTRSLPNNGPTQQRAERPGKAPIYMRSAVHAPQPRLQPGTGADVAAAGVARADLPTDLPHAPVRAHAERSSPDPPTKWDYAAPRSETQVGTTGSRVGRAVPLARLGGRRVRDLGDARA